MCKIKNKIHAKTETAQNDTDFSCIKFDINVSKGYAFVKHFETLISNLIQQQISVILSYFSFYKYFILFFCTGRVREHLNFHGIVIKLFDIVFVSRSLTKALIWAIIGRFHDVNPLDKVRFTSLNYCQAYLWH